MPTNQAIRSHITTNHEAIRRWVEARGGVPARVKGTGGEGDAGVLRIDFNKVIERGGNLEAISWEEFFWTFERNRLAFLYQEELLSEEGDYFKFVNAEFSDNQAQTKAEKDAEDEDPDADNGIE